MMNHGEADEAKTRPLEIIRCKVCHQQMNEYDHGYLGCDCKGWGSDTESDNDLGVFDEQRHEIIPVVPAADLEEIEGLWADQRTAAGQYATELADIRQVTNRRKFMTTLDGVRELANEKEATCRQLETLYQAIEEYRGGIRSMSVIDALGSALGDTEALLGISSRSEVD